MRKGEKMPDEMKKKLSDFRKAYRHSKEARLKMSIFGKRRYSTPEKVAALIAQFGGIKAGEQHPSWVGGVLSYWKREARKRDKDICQECGWNEPFIMQVDHIKPVVLFPELRLSLDNLVTLCPNCHMRKSNRERSELKICVVGKEKKQKLAFTIPKQEMTNAPQGAIMR